MAFVSSSTKILTLDLAIDLTYSVVGNDARTGGTATASGTVCGATVDFSVSI